MLNKTGPRSSAVEEPRPGAEAGASESRDAATRRKGLSRRPKGTGPGQRSKMVADRIEDALTLQAAIDHYRQEIAAGFGEWLAPVLAEGEALPDHAFSLELVGRRVIAAMEQLDRADVAYGDAAARRAYWRIQCEEQARKQLNPLMVDARRKIDAMFGREDGSKIHCLEGKTRRAPGPLLRQALRMVPGMADYACESRQGSNRAAVVAGLLSRIDPAYDRLAELMKELSHFESQEHLARDRRKAEIKAFDAVYVQALHYAEAMFALSGVEGRLRGLRSYVQRRRLSRWARAKREAYAAAQADSGQEPDKQGIRAFGARIAGWFRRSSGGGSAKRRAGVRQEVA